MCSSQPNHFDVPQKMTITLREKTGGGVPTHVYSSRIGPIQGLPGLLVEFGCQPAAVFAKAGVALSVFANADNRISLDDLGSLLQTCVTETACPHFGLLVGQRFTLDALADIGQLLRNSPTVGDACRQLILHLHLQDRGAVPLLMFTSARHAALGYSVLRYETVAIRQFHDSVNAIVVCLLREICGQTWRPLEVWFAHSRPADLTHYRQFFGTRLHFDADVSAVVFAADWLRQPVKNADPAEYARLLEKMAALDCALGLSFATKVQRTLQSMVFSGTASIEGLAHLFQLQERTLRRRLEKESTTAHQLIQEVLFSVARQLLQETGLSISEIASALHYNDTAAFSNAFRRWAGVSPRQWRRSIYALENKSATPAVQTGSVH
jgi:AraC-like DNA-binding protein